MDAAHATVLGVDFFNGGLLSGAQLVVARALSRDGGYACLGNVHLLVGAQHDAQLRQALRRAWLVFPDGAPVAWLQRRKGLRDSVRVAGPDLMPLVIEQSGALGMRHFLLGSTTHVLERLCRNLERAYPRVRIAGTYSPSRREIDDDDPALVQRVRMHGPDVVWCAFGAPRQELWMSRHAEELRPTVLVGVGAAFEFLAGTKPRAPVWMQQRGLEWLQRLACEPSRLGGRYLRTNTEFVFRAIIELSRNKRR